MEENNKICNLKEKKIVFFDIDDTLYLPKLGVPASAVSAIKMLRKNGHLAFICTGRSRSMVFPSIIDIGFDGIIAGAGTYCEMNGEVLFRHDMDEKDIAGVVKKLREFQFIPVPEGHDYLYYEDESKWNDRYRAVYSKFFKEVGSAMVKIPADDNGMCAAKVSAVFKNESLFEEAEKYFKDDYTVINHGGSLLELIPKGFSKAEGIKYVIRKTGILWENTYAFGDSMNDYEMLEFVNHSVAMGNSDKKIIELSKYTTDTVENDGIYKGLSSLGLI